MKSEQSSTTAAKELIRLSENLRREARWANDLCPFNQAIYNVRYAKNVHKIYEQLAKKIEEIILTFPTEILDQVELTRQIKTLQRKKRCAEQQRGIATKENLSGIWKEPERPYIKSTMKVF